MAHHQFYTDDPFLSAPHDCWQSMMSHAEPNNHTYRKTHQHVVFAEPN